MAAGLVVGTGIEVASGADSGTVVGAKVVAAPPQAASTMLNTRTPAIKTLRLRIQYSSYMCRLIFPFLVSGLILCHNPHQNEIGRPHFPDPDPKGRSFHWTESVKLLSLSYLIASL